MKSFKNIMAIVTLLTVGAIYAKIMKKQTSIQMPIPTMQPSFTSGVYPEPVEGKGKQLQKGTYTEFLTELNNMQTEDLFTPDKSKFSDNIVQLFARIEISNLSEIEKDALMQALINNIAMNDPEAGQKITALFNDLRIRIENLISEQFKSE
jgi:hypothetical protein